MTHSCTSFGFRCLAAAFLVSILFLTGCVKNVPDGFPKTFPATMILLHAGQPYTDAKVFLSPVQGDAFWSVGGDAEGDKFQFTTVQGSHSVKGIPAGEYIVTINHFKLVDASLPSDYDELPIEERAKASAAVEKAQADARAGSKIPEELSQPDSSPIRWTVSASNGNELTVKLDDY